jgi:hypothetical protein
VTVRTLFVSLISAIANDHFMCRCVISLFYTRAKTLLSLAKLSALATTTEDTAVATEAEDFIARKNQQLYITEVQIAQRLQPASVKDSGKTTPRASCCSLA